MANSLQYKKVITHFVIILAMTVSIMGVAYRPFLLYNPTTNPWDAQSDAPNYLHLFDHEYSKASPIHRYRIGIPLLAARLPKLPGITEDGIASNHSPLKRLSFYIINNVFLGLSCWFSLVSAQSLTRKPLIIAPQFASCLLCYMTPAVIGIASAPVVDSAVILFVSINIFLAISNRTKYLPLLSILFMPFNERVIAYVLTLLSPSIEWKALSKRLFTFFLTLVLSLIAAVIIKNYVDLNTTDFSRGLSLSQTTFYHLQNILKTFLHYFKRPFLVFRHIFFDLGVIPVSSYILSIFILIDSRYHFLNSAKKEAGIIIYYAKASLAYLAVSLLLVLMSGDFVRMLLPLTPIAATCAALLMDLWLQKYLSGRIV